jgi:hypothetical protein
MIEVSLELGKPALYILAGNLLHCDFLRVAASLHLCNLLLLISCAQ